MAEHIQAQLISPVQVFQDDQHRSARIRGDQQVGHVLHQQTPPVMGVTGVSGDRTHPCHQAPPEVAEGRLGCGHQTAGQVQQQAGQRLHVTGERRRPGHGETAGAGLPRDRAEQAGLADASLARHKQQPARARRGAGKPLLDESQEGIPADQHRRLDHPASPHHAPPSEDKYPAPAD